MKNLFKKIIKSCIEEEVAYKLEVERLNRDSLIKTECGRVIRDLFDENAADYEEYGSYFNRHVKKSIKANLKVGIAEIVLRNIKDDINAMLDDKVNGEEFIDGIIERIKRKQL